MKKLLLLGFLSMFGASQANAGFVSVVTGADMAGIKVTATFDDGSSESLLWSVFSTGTGTPTTGIAETIRLESEVGGVEGRMFSLMQQGDSQGNTDNNNTPSDFSDDVFFGLWSLENLSNALLTSLVIDVMNTNVVFDTAYSDNGNGSGLGRAFIIKPEPGLIASSTYGNQIQDELYGTLQVNLALDGGAGIKFMADTDIQEVPAPASLSLLLLALGGLVVRRNKA